MTSFVYDYAHTLLSVATPVAVDQVGATKQVVPSSRAAFLEGQYDFAVQFVATQTGGVTSPTTDVRLETSQDGVNWVVAFAMTQLTADGTVVELRSPKLARWVRAVTQLGGGTPPNHTAEVVLLSTAPFALRD